MEKIYDNIFKTMITRNPHLVIPLINEIFGTNYPYDRKVVLLSDEHQTERSSDGSENGEIISDSYISIDKDNYHLECQSNPDGTILFRMIEYDFHIALDDALRSGKSNLFFPRSAVLYLRHNKNTEENLSLNIIFPNEQSVKYDIRIIKAKNISKDEIIQKKLYFLAPYYIMRVEEEPLKKVLDEYVDILMAMSKDREKGLFTEYDIASVYTNFSRLIDVVYTAPEIREGVDSIMGGKVLYSEIDKVYDEGIEKGVEQAMLVSIKSLMKNMNISSEKAMELLEIPDEEKSNYLDKLES